MTVIRNQLWRIVGLHTIGFIMCGSHKMALYTFLLSAVDGDVLLLPVRVRHVENARAWLRTLSYTLCGE